METCVIKHTDKITEETKMIKEDIKSLKPFFVDMITLGHLRKFLDSFLNQVLELGYEKH